MASIDKKKKLKNSHLWKGGLKYTGKLKRIAFYNASTRKKEKSVNQTTIKEETP